MPQYHVISKTFPTDILLISMTFADHLNNRISTTTLSSRNTLNEVTSNCRSFSKLLLKIQLCFSHGMFKEHVLAKVLNSTVT